MQKKAELTINRIPSSAPSKPKRRRRIRPAGAPPAPTRATQLRAGAGRPWQPVFLAALAQRGNVSAACRAAGVSRAVAYEYREQSTAFAASWKDAIEDAMDRLEEAAYTRAVEGVERPVYYNGKQVGSVTQYADGLMSLLLKAHRPEKYRENFKPQTEDDNGMSELLGLIRSEGSSPQRDPTKAPASTPAPEHAQSDCEAPAASEDDYPSQASGHA